MKRFITATLTLALTAALSADKAPAAQANQSPLLALSMVNTAESGMDDITGMLHVQIEDSGGGSNFYSSDTVDGLIAIIALTAIETGVIDPADCPSVMDDLPFLEQVVDPEDCPSVIDPADCPQIVDPQDCPDLVDLWFELVDAGYTEDEAFETIELLMDSDSAFTPKTKPLK
ncbi:MAG: hypothetical protein MK102_07750 [Fuerstiella sp.]|nr:hypothetical protein [Fuerstiella sp.]